MATSLEQASASRKARLEALKARKQVSDSSKKDQNEPKKPVLKFRNYNPHTEQLQEQKMPRTKPESIEEQVKEQIDLGSETETVKDVNLSKLAPKKVDWDLKREIAKKMEKVERRTQKSIVDLIRDRLQEDGSALASAVATTGVEQQPSEDYDSD